MKTNVEKMFDLYQEICKEAGLEWTLEGWDFFDKVMWTDYLRHCKASNSIPNKKKFKKDCIAIAMKMIQEAK